MDKKRNFYSKTTINLAYKDQNKGNDPKIIIPLAVILVAFTAAFGKFMVSDKLSEAMRASAEIDSVKQQTEILREKNKEYSDIKEEYGSYSMSCYNIEELALVDITDVLEIIDSRLLSGADINSYVFNSNVLNVVLTDVTLKDVAAITSDLYSNSIVQSVSVSTATTWDNEQPTPERKVTATVSVLLGAAGSQPIQNGGGIQ